MAETDTQTTNPRGGRPPRGGESCVKTVSGRVTQTNFDWLKSEAEAQKMTRSALINRALSLLRGSVEAVPSE